jgi:hypothetical protein
MLLLIERIRGVGSPNKTCTVHRLAGTHSKPEQAIPLFSGPALDIQQDLNSDDDRLANYVGIFGNKLYTLVIVVKS